MQAGRGCCALSAYGSFWKNFLFYVDLLALFALGKLDTSPLPSYLSALVRCLGVACGVLRFDFSGILRDTWFDSGYMFYGRLWTNFSHFLRCGELES